MMVKILSNFMLKSHFNTFLDKTKTGVAVDNKGLQRYCKKVLVIRYTY